MPLFGRLHSILSTQKSSKNPNLINPHESSIEAKDLSSFKTVTIGALPQRILPPSRTRLQATLLLSAGSARVCYDESLADWKSIRLPANKQFEVDPDSEVWAASVNGSSAIIGVVQHYH